MTSANISRLLSRLNALSFISVDTTPLHWVSHAFQTVPIGFAEFAATTASKLPSTLTINAGATSVSNHSSPSGDKNIEPTQENFINGWTFSNVVANKFSVMTIFVYGRVIKSPVFW